MRRPIVVALTLAAAVLSIGVSAQKTMPPPSSDLVELAVVAIDKENHPVTDLRREEFQVKEDGHVVDLKTFARAGEDGSTAADEGRSVTLLLDDVGIPMGGTAAMRQIALIMLSSAQTNDDIAVVRLSKRNDEAFGDFDTARERIDTYHGGATPYSRRDTGQDALKAIAHIAVQREAVGHRRNIIVCVGLRSVCDIEEPSMGASSFFWPEWMAAMYAMTRANVTLYAVDPYGLNGVSGARFDGLSELTGGQLFANGNDFVRYADTIWRDASHYYLLGYWPSSQHRAVHSIDVKVSRKGVRVRARKRRLD